MDQEHFDAAVAEFSRAIGLLVRRVRAASAGHDISLTQSAVMARLERCGPTTISDLARAEGMKPQSMGAVIVALEELGIVERKPHPTDGRQMNIELTANGMSVRKSTRDAKREWLGNVIAKLPEHDRQALFAASEIIERMVEL